MSSPEAELVVTRSVWLPVGRANFYSYTANGWLSETGEFQSKYLKEEGYTPYLQVSVLRRVLEVLPRSFGYREVGDCELSNDDDDTLARPVSVTMSLEPSGARLSSGEEMVRSAPTDRSIAHARWCVHAANQRLIDAGVRLVQVRVDENGFYNFTAVGGRDPQAVEAALDQHMDEVFGGDFSLEWQTTGRTVTYSPSGGRGQSAPARLYNGLPVRDRSGEFHPRGILTFFQLNTLFEGIFNDALTPAVFFEQHAFMTRFKEIAQGRATSVVRTVSDVIGLLRTDRDATDSTGKVHTLRHFLAATSRESLQKLKWSVESVRRGLLDEMMGILHRQSRIVQLKLDKLSEREWTPELAVGANESQLRGYVMLAGAKLPLVANVHRFAVAAAAHITTHASNEELDKTDEADLFYRLKEWRDLLDALRENVNGLEKAVEHAWMERLLYEQEQSRAEQEAMAEIERSRRKRPVGGEGGPGVGGTYNALMLYFTVAAGVVAAATIDKLPEVDSLGKLARTLWPFALIAVVLSLVPLSERIRRFRRDLKSETDSYGYEFALRLDMIVDLKEIQSFMARANGKPSRAGRAAATGERPPLRKLGMDPRGGARIEVVSLDSTLIKIHSSVRFKTKRKGQLFNRTVRFEVINEFLARKVSDNPQFVLRETRVFGDAPRPLEQQEVLGLVNFVLAESGLTFQAKSNGDSEPLLAEDVLYYTRKFFGAPEPLGDEEDDDPEASP